MKNQNAVAVARRATGQNQTEFAELLGVSRGYLADVETGKREFTSSFQRKIFIATGAWIRFLPNGELAPPEPIGAKQAGFFTDVEVEKLLEGFGILARRFCEESGEQFDETQMIKTMRNRYYGGPVAFDSSGDQSFLGLKRGLRVSDAKTSEPEQYNEADWKNWQDRRKADFASLAYWGRILQVASIKEEKAPQIQAELTASLWDIAEKYGLVDTINGLLQEEKLRWAPWTSVPDSLKRTLDGKEE